MLRLQSQQALKTLCGPLRNPLRNPLHIRHVHVEQAPFSGPPSYATIARRFSLHPNSLLFFTEKKAKEAKERGEFIDIHDIGGVSPKDFDALITDMDDKNLRSEVAELISIPYLEKTTKKEANNKVNLGHGIVYGDKFRVLFPHIVGLEDKAHWVFFIMVSGAPLTYLSVQMSAPTNRKNTWPLNLALGGRSSRYQKGPCACYDCWIRPLSSSVTIEFTLCRYQHSWL